MLILKQPLQCKALSPLSTISDSFEEKLFGNYQLMSARIRKEELLYLISMPPEIYMGGEGMTSILNENTIKNSQSINVEVMNHLFNRILLWQGGRFTYQDSVYVTAVLQKLGIQDVKSFMKQVTELREETRQVRRLTMLYESHSDRLQQLFALLQAGERAEEEKETQEEKRTAEYHLHHSIYRRLKTEAVYQAVANYARNQASEEYEITNQELLTAEYRKLAQEITLNRVRKQAIRQEMPLLFCHMNRYELEAQEETQITESSMVSQLNAAVLLNLVDNMYTSRAEKWVKGPENSFRLAQAIYQAGENTMKRFEFFHRAALIKNRDTENYVTELNQAYRAEINTISRLFGEEKAVSSERYFESEQSVYQTADYASTGNQYEFSSLMENHTSEHSLNLQYVDEKQIEEWDEETKAEYYQNIRQNLDKINEQNLVMREKLMQFDRTSPVYKNITVDREKARRDSLRALENPGEVLLEYMQETSREEKLESRAEEQIFQLFSRETRAIYEQLLQRREAVETEHSLTERLLPGSEERLRQEIEEAREEERQKKTDEKTSAADQEAASALSTENLYQILRHIEKNLISAQEKDSAGGQNAAYPALRTERLLKERRELQGLIERDELPVQIEQKEKETLLYYLELLPEQQELLPEPVTEEIEARLERLKELAVEEIAKKTEAARQKPGEWERVWQELETKVPSLTEKISSAERERVKEIKKEYALPVRQSQEKERQELPTENPLKIVREIYQRQERQLIDIRSQTVQSDSRQSELWYSKNKEQEADPELLEYHLERWLEPKEQVQVLYSSEDRRTVKNTELYHKQAETDLEELYQELEQREKLHQSRQEFSESTREESYQINRQYKESAREITVENTEDITNLIQQGVRKQIGMISEQVYSRLEKKLANERKRRGF